jgi:signal peptidase
VSAVAAGPRHVAEGGARPGEPSFWAGLRRGALAVLAAAVVALALAAVVVPRLLGAVPLAVLTGSMEPAISPGDLVVSRPVDAADLTIGDVVTFQPVSDDPMLITHRVVGIQLGGDGVATITTQGDANGGVDDPIEPEQVMGRVIYTLPYLGHVTQAVPPGARGVLVSVAGGALVVYAIYTLAVRRRHEGEVAR